MGQRVTSAAFAALMMGIATPVIAQSGEAERRFDIAAGPLDRALPVLAQQSGLQILYPSALVAGRRASPVSGAHTPRAALTLLLRDTGLSFRQSRPTVFVLFDPAARAEASDDAFEVEDVVVTGTYLRGAESPSPVTVVTQADVDRQGRSTVADTLAALPQNFTGAAYEGSANTGADRSGRNVSSATGVNLRGLGADATLVLVNGRRVAGTGNAGDFADISNIPSSAISRADVLLDGASALYGADAVGGVVNIILKSRFEGAETRLRLGATSDGGANETLVSHAGGFDWGSGSVVAAYEYHDRGELEGADRNATSDADLRRLGGTDHRPLFAAPGNIVRLDAATGGYVPLFAIPTGQNGVGLRPGDFVAGRVVAQGDRALLFSDRGRIVRLTRELALEDVGTAAAVDRPDGPLGHRAQTDPMGAVSAAALRPDGRLCRIMADNTEETCAPGAAGAGVSWGRGVSVQPGSNGRAVNELEVRSDNGVRLAWRLNPELDGVETPEAHLVEGPRGARGWLYLPQASTGEPPPVVVIPYPGRTYPAPPRTMRPETAQMTLNGALLVAAGYAVLYWSDPQRYREASAFEQAPAITAPLLLFHGEMDGSASQAEQMYAALVRLGRPVALTYLFGEDHSIHNPGNAGVYYEQVIGWFDRHLKPSQPVSARASGGAMPRAAPD